MPKYAVQFAGSNGKIATDVVDAESERSALSAVEAQGKTPISVRLSDAVAALNPNKVRRIRGGRAMRRALLDFTHQLSAVTESGIPVIAGLKAVADQTENKELRAAIGRIIGRIEGGRSLAEAMDAENQIFSDLYVKTMAAGEAAGGVPEVLEALARYMEQDADTRSQIRSAMTYPALVVCTLVIATVIMLLFVVPQFAQMFDKFGGELPLPTKILLGISDALTSHYLIVLFSLAAIGYGLRTIMSYKSARAWTDRQLLRLPVFGKLMLSIYMTRFIDLLELLTKSALPITQSLRITADSMTNYVLKVDIRGMVRSIEGGHTLGAAFAETKWVTPLVKRMLAVGEHAGRTDHILGYVGKYYSKQTQKSIKLLSTLIEPILILGLAVVVLFFALSIFLPMWKTLKLIGSA